MRFFRRRSPLLTGACSLVLLYSVVMVLALYKPLGIPAAILLTLTLVSQTLMLLILIFWIRRIHGWSRQNVRLAKTATHTLSTLEALPRQLSTLQKRLDELSSRRYVLEAASDDSHADQWLALEKPSNFSPSIVQSFASPPQSTNTRGRFAADRQTDPLSPLKLWTVTHADPSIARLSLALVSTDALAESLQKTGVRVIRLRPHMLDPQLLSDCQTIVIEEQAFTEGSWFGADSTLNSHLANSLLEFLHQCSKEHGIISIPCERTTHFTSALRSLATSILTDDISDLKWAPDKGTIAHRLLQQVVVQEETS